MKLIRIHPDDNVAVALTDLKAGERLNADGIAITAAEDVARGHKIALREIAEGEAIIKYGNPIGLAKTKIPAGSWTHVHNTRTALSEGGEYSYCPQQYPLPKPAPKSFLGYRRPDGRAPVRNELWIIPTVGCVNSVAAALVRENQHLVTGSIDGLYTFAHPYGCSQMGDDHAQTRKLLAALHCDRSLVYEAFLSDPLVRGRASESAVKSLVDDMIANTAAFLPEAWK